jgi:acetyl esterase/lipase
MAAVDDAYDNASHFPDVPQWRERWQQRNAERVPNPGERFDLAYGPEPAQRLDLLPCATAETSPTVLFFHGGFWSRNSKETFRFLAGGFHAAGLNVAFAGYTLAPTARMGRIVAEALAATRWLAAKLGDLGLAPLPLLVVGWSSGAHLAALQMAEPSVAGGMGISGVYDLRPFPGSALNDVLQLDARDVEQYSPVLQIGPGSAPFVVAFGSRERVAYREQATNFHQALRDAAVPSGLLALEGHHHHSVLDELFEPHGRLVAELAAMAERLPSMPTETHVNQGEHTA